MERRAMDDAELREFILVAIREIKLLAEYAQLPIAADHLQLL
jgi:hypothetical protein